MIKIAIVIDALATGGAEKQSLMCAAELQRRGHQVELIVYHPQNDYADFIGRHGIKVVQIRSRGLLRLGRLLKLTRHILHRRFDVVHAFGAGSAVYACLAARLARVPCIFAGLREVRGHGWLHRSFSRAAASNATGWIGNSNYVRRALVEQYGIRPKKVFVVPNGIYLDDVRCGLSRTEAKRQFGLEADELVVSMVGNLRAEKNHMMFLRMARRVTEGGIAARFLLAGEGSLRSPLEKTAVDCGLGDRVRFLGRRSDVACLYRATDVAVLTSFTEGLPNALIEAAAAGVPCVATDSGGAADVVMDGRNGHVVPVDDDQAMAGRVCELLRNPDRRAAMGAAGRQLVEEKFSAEAMGETLLSVYRGGLGPD